MNFLNGIGKSILIWSMGGLLSVLIADQIRRFLKNLSDQFIKKTKAEISSIHDENLREAAKCVVRYVASQLPETASSDERLAFAILKLQEITPNILVSDDKVKVLIESAYADFKRDLKEI